MLYYSTNLESDIVSYQEALLQGQAPDRGLYLPTYIPQFSPEELEAFRDMAYPDIAFRVIKKYTEEEIPDDVLLAMCHDAYSFPIPLEKVDGQRYVMRLDQGPTASFKDFAARMMGRQMSYFLNKEHRKLLILTATSGDTGSAVANAFLGLNNVKVVVLFPKDEVTARQRKQMTTLGQNIHILALDAKFDDCQALVKQAFSDPDLHSLNLSSANSINIGRLIPQSVYYFYAWSRVSTSSFAEPGVSTGSTTGDLPRPVAPSLSREVVPSMDPGVSTGSTTGDLPRPVAPSPPRPLVFSVPSGNFGDMMGGILAMKMGLPVKKFVIAVNENDEFPSFLESGRYQKVEPSRNCLSSAMNVGHPSNLARLLALYGGVMDEKGKIFEAPRMAEMQAEIWSTSITDEQTRQTIRDAWESHKLLLEPHGAVGWAGLTEYLAENPGDEICVSIETAHPAKFPEEIIHLLGFDPELPAALIGLETKEEQYSFIENGYGDFKEYLLKGF